MHTFSIINCAPNAPAEQVQAVQEQPEPAGPAKKRRGKAKPQVQQPEAADQAPLEARAPQDASPSTAPLGADGVRAALVERMGEDAIAQLEADGILVIRENGDGIRWADDSTQGGYVPSEERIYLFGNKLSADNVLPVFMEELGEHFGLEQVLGADGWTALAQRVAKLYEAGNEQIAAAWQAVKADYPEFTGRSDTDLRGNARFLHEVIAKAGRDRAAQGMPWYRQLIAAIKQFLLRHFGATATINDADIAAFIEGAARQVANRTSATADSFVPAPDGSDDYGQITPEMAGVMRRRAGPIRLQTGDDSFGLRHIEQRHGAQIRRAGFGSVEDFVAEVAGHIDQIWSPNATAQLIALEQRDRDNLLFIELRPSDDGDYYTVRTAFPARKSYAEKKGWNLLWEGAGEVAPTASGKPTPFAEPPPDAGEAATNASGQSRNDIVAPTTERSTTDDRPLESRAATVTSGALADAWPIAAQRAHDAIFNTITGGRTFGLWARTVGTQMDKARTNPEFRRVFERSQKFIDDIARYGLRAEGLAPTVLPKVGGLADVPNAIMQAVGKRGMSSADNEWLARTLASGTLAGLDADEPSASRCRRW